MALPRRHVSALALVCACLALPAIAAGAGFDDPTPVPPTQDFTMGGTVHRLDKPNDPGYDRAETDPNDPESASSNLYDERYDLFGFPSKHTPHVLYADPSDLGRLGKQQISGFNASGAWKVTRGNPEVVIAILDTGIRWDNARVRTQVHLNADELPPPRNAQGATEPGAPLNGYDLNRSGALDVDDYAGDPRVGEPAPTGQDLIRAFSNGDDPEGNGFVDDIAGWDFFDDDNDPDDSSSYFAARNHGTGRVEEAVERANDGEGELGVCPKCQYMPVRIWDTFVSDQTSFALGMLYATDNGASVIEGAAGGLYHSAFAERASDYAWEKGVVQVFSGDDLNTGNHNYPAAYGHAMLIEGTVTDSKGLGTNPSNPDSPVGGFPDVPEELREIMRQAARPFIGLPVGGTEVPVGTYFRSANTAQFGGKSSISMEGPTGSVNTGKASGAAGMVISAARDKGITLSADETRIILEQTAEDVLPLNTLGLGTPDPAQVGWDSHFGWGRVDLGKAVGTAATLSALPPEAVITAPDWYAPLTSDELVVKGFARAPRAGGKPFGYKLEWGVGQAPTSWTQVRSGTSTAPLGDELGRIDLAAVRAAIAASPPPVDPAGPVFSPTAPNPFATEFTVRLTVTVDGVTTPGVDRRVFNAFTDPTLRPGFPKRLGSGGEAPLRYGDLDGDNVQELVAPVEDGTIHAYRPDGSELPGWPVKTDTVLQVANHLGSPAIGSVHAAAPGLEPPRAPVLVDLDADGVVEVATTAGRHLYVWNADGKRRKGFPVSIDPDFCRAEDQRQSNPSVHRKCGFLASPAAARLRGPDAPPALVAAALDGHLYAWDRDGEPVENFPKELVDPDESATSRMYAESINQPAIDDLNADGVDDIVVATNESYGPEDPSLDQLPGLPASALNTALAQAGGTSRLYAVDGRTGAFLPGWPVKLSGAIQDTLPLIGPGHDAAIATIDGEKVIVASTTGSASIEFYSPAGEYLRSMQQSTYGAASNATDRTGTLNLFESAIVADVNGNTPAVVKYGLTLGQVANLLLVGQNVPYNHLIGAYDAKTGFALPSYPTITDDYQFLSSSTVAKVASGPLAPGNQILAGTGLGLLHAYDGRTGKDVPGFPKVTGGWLFAPAELSADGRMATVTREGFLFEWDVPGAPSCQPRGAWPTFRHDEQGSGNYDADGTPPGAPSGLKIVSSGEAGEVRFTAPGDDRMCGTPAAYVARLATGETVDLGAPAAGGSDVTRTVDLPPSGTLIVQARDEAGNLGHPASVTFPAPSPTPGVTVTPTPDGSGAGSPTPDGSGAGTPTPDGSGAGTPTPAPSASATATASPAGSPRPTVTPRPGATPFGPSGCTDRSAPRSRFFRSSRVTRNRIALRGTAADRGCKGRLRDVYVAVMRGIRRDRCRALLPSGRFSAPRSCLRTTYQRARGTSRWTFTRRGRFRAGNYTIWVRAVDRAGNVERKARERNRLKRRVR